MSRTGLAAFIASGDMYALRSPYLRMDHGEAEIVRQLARVSERRKVRFLVACLRHAWDTHVHCDAGASAEQAALALLDELLGAPDCVVPELANQLDAFRHVCDHLQAQAKAEAPGAAAAAAVCYVTGALLSWLHHACAAIAARPTLTWFEYVASTGRWPPFWLVLDGAASVGGAVERAWQTQAMSWFADEAPDEPDLHTPAWTARQYELGPIFLQLWRSPWPKKRELIAQSPDMTDRVRHLFAKLLAVKMGKENVEASDDSHHRLLAMIDANAILLDWCNAALADHEAVGGRAQAALDSVFGNARLQALVEQHGVTARRAEAVEQ